MAQYAERSQNALADVAAIYTFSVRARVHVSE